VFFYRNIYRYNIFRYNSNINMESSSGKLRLGYATESDTILVKTNSFTVFRRCKSRKFFSSSIVVVSLTVVVLCLSFALGSHASAHSKGKR